jgi:7-cyano-7-deazaguanine synthase
MFKGISLLSGGLDSSVSLAIARKKGIRVILALTFDYGQKSVLKEIKSSKSICAYLKIPHQVIRLDWFKGIIPTGGFALRKSPLIKGGKKLPSLNLADLKRDDVMSRSAKAVWVPNRNGVFINIAAALAESLKVDYIITGFNKEEAATFPDNSADFIRATNQALKWGTLNKVKVISFTIDMNKTDIIQTGRRLGLPIEKTWSCYEGGKTPCGKCESCIRRKRADK